jgi:HKD family nuclease
MLPMKTDLIIQPDSQLGLILINLLQSQAPFFDKIWIISAFANRPGVRHLAPHILQAKLRGAHIRIVVGIDHKSTSVEALRGLLALGVDTKIVHNTRPGHTFHPKIYLFEATGIKAKLVVGSNNLTEGGLFTNYEASTQLTFDLPEDEEEYSTLKEALERYLDPGGTTALSLTDDVINILVQRKEVPTEKEAKEARNQAAKPDKNSSTDVPKSPFGSERLKPPPSLPKLSKTESAKNAARRKTSRTTPATPGELVWQRDSLPASSVQRQPGNPTGGLRLVQAGWKIGEKIIDQTTYFRYDVFGQLNWSKGILAPKAREAARATFVVNILGKNYGQHELTISHKPSGEAGQGNYTTMLHWGDLGEIVRKLDLVGRTLKLYAPPHGRIDPFYIEIK